MLTSASSLTETRERLVKSAVPVSVSAAAVAATISHSGREELCCEKKERKTGHKKEAPREECEVEEDEGAIRGGLFGEEDECKKASVDPTSHVAAAPAKISAQASRMMEEVDVDEDQVSRMVQWSTMRDDS